MKDSELLEGAYRCEKKHLLNWLIPRVGINEAEDILHDVFVRTAVNLDTSQVIVNLQAWIWRSVRNMVIDHWRKKRNRQFIQEEEDSIEKIADDMQKSAEEELEQQELLSVLRGAIQKLPPEQKEVITSQLINDETFSELSARTGVSINTLAARKRYALATIRRILTTAFS